MKKKRIIIFIAILILVVLAGVILTINKSNIEKIIGLKSRKLSSDVVATYEIKEETDDEEKVLIKFESPIENIEYIIMPDNNVITLNNNRKMLAIDYAFKKEIKQTVTFKVKTTNNEEKDFILRENMLPEISLGSVDKYPILTANGVNNINRDIEINSTKEEGYKTYYSTDEGTTWNIYEGKFNVGLDVNSVLAKETNDNINEIVSYSTSKWDYNNEMANDAIHIGAYDGDMDTSAIMSYKYTKYNTTRYMLVDESIRGYDVQIKWWNWNYRGYYSTITFLDENDSEIVKYTLPSNTLYDNKYDIPTNCTKIKYFVLYPDIYGGEDQWSGSEVGYGQLYEIKPNASIKTNFTKKADSIKAEVSTNKINDEGKSYSYYIRKSKDTEAEEYEIKAENISESSYTFTNLVDYTEYDIKIVVRDKEGNECVKEYPKTRTASNGKSILSYISSDEVNTSGKEYSLTASGVTYNFEVAYLTPATASNYNATYDSATNTYTVGNLNLGTANPNAEGNDGIQRMAVLKCDGNLNITGTITTNTYETTSEAGVTGNITKIKGLFVYCKGTLTNTGKITQTARGTCDTPGENIYLSLNNDDTYEYIPAEGGNGGTGRREGWWSSPNAGLASTIKRGTGGGSAGKSTHHTSGSDSLGGSGTSGTSYSGGTRRRWLCVSEVETKVEMQRKMVVLEEMDMVLLVAAEQETQVEKVELMILTEKLELEVYL